jgi:hypothetical protein
MRTHLRRKMLFSNTGDSKMLVEKAGPELSAYAGPL